MKKITLLTALVFSLTMMFSSPSFAEWVKVGVSKNGTYYLDFSKIRKIDGLVYWWELGDFLKPNNRGHLSAKVYVQGDCKLYRFKGLSYSFHKEPMGEGDGEIVAP